MSVELYLSNYDLLASRAFLARKYNTKVVSIKMKKRIMCFILVLALFVSMGIAYAAGYNFTFNPNITNNLLKTPSSVAATSSPYVQPSVNAASTTYYLGTSNGSIASFAVTKSNTTYSSFTYRSGYGGSGQYYYLYGYPSNGVGFGYYNVYGSWSA